MGFTANKVETPQDIPSRGVSSTSSIELNKQEVEIILTAIKSATFRGDALGILFQLVDKLEKNYKKL